jgi:uncharacterized protein YeaO (DUF488 family)
MRSDAAISDIRRLAEMAESGSITLMCVCDDENRCHRRLLRELIIEIALGVNGRGLRVRL